MNTTPTERQILDTILDNVDIRGIDLRAYENKFKNEESGLFDSLNKLYNNPIKVGDTVECVKNCGLDDAGGFAQELRWHIGDRIVVDKIESFPWGTFLNDDKGHNIDIKRVKKIEDNRPTYKQVDIYNTISELIEKEKYAIEMLDNTSASEITWHLGRKALLESLLFKF